MDLNEQILSELSAIRKMLTILAQDKLDAFNENIKNKYLTTEQRQRMYDLFDGTRSLKEVSIEVKTSSEAVRQFSVLLEKSSLIEYVQINAKTKYPKRIF